MKLFLIFILSFPLCAMADMSGDEDDFVIDNRSVGTNPGDNKGTGLTTGSGQNGTGSNSGTTNDDGQDLNETQGFQATTDGALKNANKTSDSGGSQQMLGLALGAGFAAVCPTPGGQWACAPAVMSFLDALKGGEAKGNGMSTASFLDPNTGADDFDSGSGDDNYNEQAADGLKELEGMGYTVNADGSVNLPNGTSVNSGDFASAESLTGIGFTPGQAGNVMQQMSDIKSAAAKKAGVDIGETAAVASGAVGESSSGDGFTSGSLGSGDIATEEIVFKRRNKKEMERMPASEAAKLSRNFNGDPIGIGMADIFLIVHQKYQEYSKKRTEFINKEYVDEEN